MVKCIHPPPSAALFELSLTHMPFVSSAMPFEL